MRTSFSLMLIGYSIGLALLAQTSHAQSKHSALEKPIEVTLCKLVAKCKKFDGKRVRFHASVISDWFEHTALFDRKCQRGLVPWIPDELEKHPDIEAFNRAMEEGKPGRRDLRIAAVFTGRFTCKSTSSFHRGRSILEIEEISELEVTRVKEGAGGPPSPPK